MNLIISWYYHGNCWMIPAISAYSVKCNGGVDAKYVLYTDNLDIIEDSKKVFDDVIYQPANESVFKDTRLSHWDNTNPFWFCERWRKVFKNDGNIHIALDTDMLCIRSIATLVDAFKRADVGFALCRYGNGGLVLWGPKLNKDIVDYALPLFTDRDKYSRFVTQAKNKYHGTNDELILKSIIAKFPDNSAYLPGDHQWIPSCCEDLSDNKDISFIHFAGWKPWCQKICSHVPTPEAVFQWHKFYTKFCNDFNIEYPVYDAAYLTSLYSDSLSKCLETYPSTYFPEPIIWNKYDWRTYDTGLYSGDTFAIKTRTVVDMHLGIIKDALDKGYNSIIVFEDNMKPLANWEYKLKLFHRDSPLDADLLYYGYHEDWNSKHDIISDSIIQPSHPAGNFAFGIMNRSTMRLMYDTGQRCKNLIQYRYKPMDFIIPKELIAPKKVKAYAPKMKVFGQREHTSSWDGVHLAESNNKYNIDGK